MVPTGGYNQIACEFLMRSWSRWISSEITLHFAVDQYINRQNTQGVMLSVTVAIVTGQRVIFARKYQNSSDRAFQFDLKKTVWNVRGHTLLKLR